MLAADGARPRSSSARKHRVDVVLTDLMMPGMTGHRAARACKQLSPETEVVLMTAYGTVETAVQAMREGAYDFVNKPLKRHDVVKSVRKAPEKQSLRRGEPLARSELASCATRRAIVGAVAGAARARSTSCDAGGAVDAPPCWCSARAAPARSCSRAPSTSTRRARRARSCRQLRGDPRDASSRASCSATSGARSPAPSQRKEGRFERAARRHAVPRRDRRAAARRCRSSCCACCRRARSSALGGTPP